MEHIYTIKVKRKFDPREQYPSERRYSASTVLGFSWVYLALACTSFLLACLALYNPPNSTTNVHITEKYLPKLTPAIERILEEEAIAENSTIESIEDVESNTKKTISDYLQPIETNGYEATLIIAPCLLALGAFVAGFAAIIASKRWYVDHSITWFFLSSIFSTVLSMVALGMIAIWIAAISESSFSFTDYFSDGNLDNKAKVEVDISQDGSFKNDTLLYVIKIPLEELRQHKIPLLGEGTKESQTRKVLSVNIVIAALVEIIWSLLSLKIAWSGMRANYPDDDTLNNRKTGSTVHVVTELKGNNTKRLPKNTKILPPKPDLIEHYPKNNKIKKFFQNQQENGSLFLHTNRNDGLIMVGGKTDKPSDISAQESSSEYRERMLNFLNKCASNEGIDAPESFTDPGCISNPETIQNEEQKNVIRSDDDINKKKLNRLSVLSWGDPRDHPVYDQNTLDLDSIMMNFKRLDKQEQEIKDAKAADDIQSEQ